MSSPTILFVMDHLLEKTDAAHAPLTHAPLTHAPLKGLSLGFGPGVTLEGMLWHQGGGHG
jgi:predicted naringenin-chalcone synthase